MVEVLLGYNNGNGVFYVIRAKMFLAGSFEFWSSELSASQLSEVT
jgi:hypothetical protein